ncbi:ABC transporter substrate-binding protein [Clostridium malenominatum]
MRRKSSRGFFLIMLAFCLVLFSCNSKTPQNGFNKRLRGQVNIIVEKEKEYYIKTFAKEFTGVFPSVSFNIKVEEDFYDNTEEILNARGENRNDIIIMDTKYSPYIVKEYSDELWDISSILEPYKDSYYKEDIKKFALDQGIYGLPLDKKPYFMIYRKDIFEKGKIKSENIRTWQEFISKCKELNKSLNKDYKFMWEEKDNDIYHVMLSQVAGSNNYFSENSSLSSDKIKKVTLTKELLKKENMISREDLIEGIKKERVIATMVSMELLHEIMNSLPEMKGKWTLTKVPAFEIGGNREVLLEGHSIFISRDSSNKDAVLTFLEYIIANEKIQQQLLLGKGIFSSNVNSLKWSDLNKKVEYYNNAKLWILAANAEKLLMGK